MSKVSKEVSGFTLIELMVTIAVIAIMATVSVTIFAGAQKNARDGKRKGDVDALMSSLEVNRSTTGYQSLKPSQFANGVVPVTDSSAYNYCYQSSANANIPADPANPDSTPLTTNWTTTCPTNYLAVLGDGTTPATTTKPIKVCSTLENAPYYYCRATSQ